MLRNIILCILITLFFSFTTFSYGRLEPAAGSRNRDGDPPNIVLFIADDLAAEDIAPYGNRVIRTPNLDRLVEQSMLFSEAFAASPTCSPSRATIHTGLFPFRNGAHANHTGINEGIRTLPDYLRSLGYKAAIAGKYHIGPRKAYPFELIHGTNVPEPGHEDEGVLWTDLKMGPVDRWLGEQNEENPFLLVVNDHSPHVRWPENAEYKPSSVNVPSRHIDTEETRKARARYYTDITKMDRNVGKLMESLEKHGLTESTVLFFTADQGPQWAFGKWNLYDYGLKVPLMVRWPGEIEGGSDNGKLVSLVDLLPTIVEMAGGTAPRRPEEIDGKSFLSVLFGKQLEHRRQVFATHTGDGRMNRSPMRMIRTERYKYIVNLAPDIRYTTHMDQNRKAGYWDSWVKKSHKTEHAASVLWQYHNRPVEELYDVQADPNETRNLAADPAYIELLERFRREMTEWRDQQGDDESGPYEPSEKTRKKNITPYIFR